MKKQTTDAAVFVFALIGRFKGFEAEAAVVPCLKNSLGIKIVSRSGTEGEIKVCMSC